MTALALALTIVNVVFAEGPLLRSCVALVLMACTSTATCYWLPVLRRLQLTDDVGSTDAALRRACAGDLALPGTT